MPHYRRKPEIVEAVQFTSPKVIREFCKEAEEYPGGIYVNTERGVEILFTEEWLIKDPDGNYSIMPPDIFEQTYERVEEGR